MLAATQSHAAKKVNRPRGHSCCVCTRAQPSGPQNSRLGFTTTFRCTAPGPTRRKTANRIRKRASFTTKLWWTDHQAQGGKQTVAFTDEALGHKFEGAPTSSEDAFAKGVNSLFKGVGKAMDAMADLSGASGGEEQLKTQLAVNLVVAAAAEFADNEEF